MALLQLIKIEGSLAKTQHVKNLQREWKQNITTREDQQIINIFFICVFPLTSLSVTNDFNYNLCIEFTRSFIHTSLPFLNKLAFYEWPGKTSFAMRVQFQKIKKNPVFHDMSSSMKLKEALQPDYYC